MWSQSMAQWLHCLPAACSAVAMPCLPTRWLVCSQATLTYNACELGLLQQPPTMSRLLSYIYIHLHPRYAHRTAGRNVQAPQQQPLVSNGKSGVSPCFVFFFFCRCVGSVSVGGNNIVCARTYHHQPANTHSRGMRQCFSVSVLMTQGGCWRSICALQ